MKSLLTLFLIFSAIVCAQSQTLSSAGWKWRFKSPADNATGLFVTTDAIYFADVKETLRRVDQASGKLRWSYSIKNQKLRDLQSASVQATNETVLFAVYDNDSKAQDYYSLDAATGREKWRHSSKGFNPAPLISEDVAVLSDDRNGIVALDLKTGAEKWRNNVCPGYREKPAANNKLMFVPCVNGRLLALDAATGQIVWQAGKRGLIKSDLQLANGRVFLHRSDVNGTLLEALDANSGALLWRRDVSEEYYSPRIYADDNAVYLGEQVRPLIALDAATGAQKWQFEVANPEDTLYLGGVKQTPGKYEIAPILTVENTLYCRGQNNVLYAFDRETGKLRWQKSYEDYLLYVISSDGKVGYAPAGKFVNVFDLQTGAILYRVRAYDEITSDLIIENNILYFNDSENSVNAIDLTKASTIARRVKTFGAPAAYRPRAKQSKNIPAVIMSAGSPSSEIIEPVYAGNLMFVAVNKIGAETTVYAINQATGAKTLFAREAGHATALAAEQNTLYVATKIGILSAFDLTSGARKWQFVAGSEVNLVPIIRGNKILFVAGKKLIILDAAKGEKLAEKDIRGDKYGNTRGTFDLVGDSLYALQSDGKIYADDLTSQKNLWRFAAAGKFPDCGRFTVAPDAKTIYVGNRDGFIYALDAQSGEEIWKHDTEGTCYDAPILQNNILYYVSKADDDLLLHAFDSQNGKLLWQSKSGDLSYGYFNEVPLFAGDFAIALKGEQNPKIYEARTGTRQKDLFAEDLGKLISVTPQANVIFHNYGDDEQLRITAADAVSGRVRWKITF